MKKFGAKALVDFILPLIPLPDIWTYSVYTQPGAGYSLGLMQILGMKEF